MNLDDLATAISAISDDPVVQGLSILLMDWKTSDQTAADLEKSVERFVGNSWIEDDAEHERAYSLWVHFRDQAIGAIDGMTMNERLYYFSLFAHFDECVDEERRLTIYRKLDATP